MPRRVKQTKSIFTPLTGNFFRRVSTSDDRQRRKILMYGLILFCVFAVYSIMSSTYGMRRIVKLELEKETLIVTNRQEMAKLIDADNMVAMLKTDPAYIGYIARTRFHMVYPGETIYRYFGQ